MLYKTVYTLLDSLTQCGEWVTWSSGLLYNVTMASCCPQEQGECDYIDLVDDNLYFVLEDGKDEVMSNKFYHLTFLYVIMFFSDH